MICGIYFGKETDGPPDGKLYLILDICYTEQASACNILMLAAEKQTIFILLCLWLSKLSVSINSQYGKQQKASSAVLR